MLGVLEHFDIYCVVNQCTKQFAVEEVEENVIAPSTSTKNLKHDE